MEEPTKSCRCCMKTNSEIGLFNILQNLNGLQLTTVYLNCTGIQISPSEPLPLDVCELCVAQLKNFSEFRAQCLHSDSIYRASCLKREPTNDDTFVDVQVKCEIIDGSLEIDDRYDDRDSDDNYSDSVKKEKSSKSRHKKERKHKIQKSNDDSDSSSDSEEEKDNKKSNKKRAKRDRKSEKKHLEVFPCTIEGCKRRFFVARMLEGHLRWHAGQKAAACPHCNKEFTKFYTLDEHILAVHTVNESGVEMKCSFEGCGKTFLSEILYKRHTHYAHKPKPVAALEKWYTCHECGKSFSNSAALKKHIYTHMAQKPFQCQQCPRSFVTKDKLKHHNNRHAGIKNFVCPTCGLRKTTKDELRNHINTHTKEITWPCKIEGCMSVFGSSNSVKRHIKNVHEGARDFRCTQCDQCYAKKETLKNHMVRVHGTTLNAY